MFAVIGTVPDENFPLTAGTVSISGDILRIRDIGIDVDRGTPALLAAAICICEYFEKPGPFAYLIGDTGRGEGSRELYRFLADDLPQRCFTGLAFHYIQPDVDWHDKILFAIDRMNPRPVLTADAGFMYAAKMSGQAGAYDLFTPDIGELAFLADEFAPHPFYTRGFLFHESLRAPELINRAYLHQNASKYLLVKGETDMVANRQGILLTVSEPLVPALEAIGGTGDVVTGLAAALIGIGFEIPVACETAAKASRIAGRIADSNPGTRIMDIIRKLPESLDFLNLHTI